MKKVLIAILLAFVSTATFAQRPDANTTPEQRAEAQTKTMTESLKLSEDQQKQIYVLNLDNIKKRQEMRDSPNADRSKMRESMEAFNAEITKILTPEQQEKYKVMLEERRNRGGGGPRR